MTSCEQRLVDITTRLNYTISRLDEQKTKQDKIIEILNEILKVLAGYTK